ncbi:unnamed protein product, partial [Ectocarpus sp. 6 AP-2014]
MVHTIALAKSCIQKCGEISSRTAVLSVTHLRASVRFLARLNLLEPGSFGAGFLLGCSVS